MSGTFIVKTKISKSCLKPAKQQTISDSIINESTLEGVESSRASRLRASVQNVPPGHLSPKFGNGLNQQRTPNPLIKYSYISPDPGAKEEGAYADSAVIPAFCTLSNKKSSTRRINEGGQRGLSCPTGKTNTHKVDMNQFSNQLDQVPKIKGIKKQELLSLYLAKCQDLQINASKM